MSLSRSALVILALVAFWLAMEGGYARFEEGKEALVSRTLLSADLSRARETERIGQQASTFATPKKDPKNAVSEIQASAIPGDRAVAVRPEVKKTPGSRGGAKKGEKGQEGVGAIGADAPSAANSEPPSNTARSAAELKTEIGEINRKLDELRRASVTLSIAGTNLPPQLSLAPVVWLAALAVWLMYFDAKRSSAHLNLFAYHLALPPSDRRLGAAGEGALWLAPLPSAMPKGLSDHGTAIDEDTRRQIRDLIGWDKETERGYRLALLFVGLLVAAIALRVAWIGIDLTSPSAVVLKIVGPFWKIAGLVLVVILVTISAVYLMQLTTTRAHTRYLFESVPLSRRALISGGLATLICAGLLGRSQGWLPKRLLPRIGPSGGRGVSRLRRPRFVSEARKQARLGRYRVFVKPSAKPVGRERFYLSQRSREPQSPVTIHVADKQGRIRLFSAAEAIPAMQARSADDLLKHLSNINADATTAFEVAAMRHLRFAIAAQPGAIRMSPLIQACNILRGGVLVCLEGKARRPNLRLLDLLAGLAVRYDMPGRLNDLIAVLQHQRFAALRSSWLARRKGQPFDPVEQRIKTWRKPDSEWRRQWVKEKRRWKVPSESVAALKTGDLTVYWRDDGNHKLPKQLEPPKQPEPLSLMLPRPSRVTRIP